jgi:hypothetical protein
MNSGRVALGIIIILAFTVMGLFFTAAKMPNSYAATVGNRTTTAQVIVNGFVSITIQNVPVYFTQLDPGTTNQLANATGGAPLYVSVDGVTNVVTKVLINASTFVSAALTMLSPNMSWNVSKSASATANATCAADSAPCKYSIERALAFTETARSGVGANSSIYNWISVPAIQDPGTYIGNLDIYATQ